MSSDAVKVDNRVLMAVSVGWDMNNILYNTLITIYTQGVGVSVFGMLECVCVCLIQDTRCFLFLHSCVLETLSG